MAQDILPPEPSPEEQMLQQAIELIEQSKFAEARDLLTKLLKVNQNDPTIWVWLSAAMETQKERLYCLQTAYKLDPTNSAAKRGLILMGALPADDTTPPFPMNHPRPWQSKVKIEEKARPTGIKALIANPVARIGAIVLAAVLLLSGVIGGFAATTKLKPFPTQQILEGSFTPTVTMISNKTANAPVGNLADLLDATYTPTPVYAATPHGDLAQDSYRGAVRAYEKGQWEMVSIMMEQVATAHPGSADAMYFIAESYRLSSKYEEALAAYQEAINVNPDFAPIYLGRARTNMELHPKPNVRQQKEIVDDLQLAVDLDPNFAEAFMELGLYQLKQGDIENAQFNLNRSASINPESPLVQVALARAELEMGNTEAALDAAIKANQQDLTMLEGYLVLGMAYRADGQTSKAVETLETYIQYAPNNADVYAVLGSAYFNDGRYEDAMDAFNRALQIDKTSSEAYYWRAETNIALENYTGALADFKQSLNYNQNSFKASMGIARAQFAQGDANNAYAQILKTEGLAKTDPDRVLLYYYRAQALDALNFADVAIKDWQALLAMPPELLTEEMLADAEERIGDAVTPTAEPTSPSATRAPAASATRQPTATLKPTQTRQPTATP